VRQVGYLQELYRDARSAEHKILQSIYLNILNYYHFIICRGVCLDLPSVGMLHCAGCDLVTVVLGQCVGFIFKGQAAITFKM